MALRIPALVASFVCLLLSSTQAGQEECKPPQRNLTAVTYYIAARARLMSPNWISLFIATNLPPGSNVDVNIYDFLGQGSKDFIEGEGVKIPKEGLVWVKIEPKKGMEFRNNLICDVVFMPTDPRQLPEVRKFFGPRAERLGSPATNPQVGIGSPGAYLSELTVVYD